ncbi:hypothetical protein G6F22_013451 [Rhizopus arrhizus]|nr:hypothetical protein G6F22_013451 [Rhizopus arrhizus]
MSGYYHYRFKLVLIGDSEVGKSNIMSRFTRNGFDLEFNSTMGIDYESKVLEVDNHIVKAQIWDTSGQERFRSLFPSYCRDAKGVFIVYGKTK